MKYYIDKTIKAPFEKVERKVTEALKEQGFGVLTEIDVKEVFKKKLSIDFRKYKILGACNPNFAHEALSFENKIGTMLPCNIVLQELSDDTTEVAAVDPMASMMSMDNEKLEELATKVQGKLLHIIDSL